MPFVSKASGNRLGEWFLHLHPVRREFASPEPEWTTSIRCLLRCDGPVKDCVDGGSDG